MVEYVCEPAKVPPVTGAQSVLFPSPQLIRYSWVSAVPGSVYVAIGSRTNGSLTTTVAVGEPRFARELEVSAGSMPRRTLQDASIVADVVVTHRGLGGETVKLLVEEDGELVSLEEITLDAWLKTSRLKQYWYGAAALFSPLL